ncbi:uncharacterized protein LOC141601621 [Silene latifolia]|uniref:uncharacterized protein LOC141601621 n=1 Tax=Silene latifolia TaxID=37657 RepID=UPI003D779A18
MAEVLRPRTSSRLLLRMPMGPVLCLGERLTRQCSRDTFTVPIDPPRMMFRENSEAEREANLADASGDALLLPGEEYSDFIHRRLAYWLIVEIEVAGVEPPAYPEVLEYTNAAGMTTISELRDFGEEVTDAGLEEWPPLVSRVAPSRYVTLWRVANRPRATAIEALVGGRGRQRVLDLEREPAQSREETTRLLRELEVRDADIAALEANVAELSCDQDWLPLFCCCLVYILYILDFSDLVSGESPQFDLQWRKAGTPEEREKLRKHEPVDYKILEVAKENQNFYTVSQKERSSPSGRTN